MVSSWQERAIVVFLSVGAMLVVAGAEAQDTTEQVLDRVNAVSPKAVLDMPFDDPVKNFDLPIETGKGFTSCQLTANRGLFCLDQNAETGRPGRWVRNWNPVFDQSEEFASGKPYYFTCEDTELGLDISKSVESCTSITADDDGKVVIAGKRKGGYNLIKVARVIDFKPAVTSCPSGWSPMDPRTSPDFCYKVMLPRDRPLLVDITYASISIASALKPAGGMCTGIIGLENRTALVFLRDLDADNDDCPADIQQTELVGFKAWDPKLATGEVLQSASTLKFDIGGNSYVLTVSNTGIVRAKQTNALQGTYPVTLVREREVEEDGEVNKVLDRYKNLTLLRDSRAPASCNSLAQKFAIRTSPKSGRLYVTDYNFCEASALEPANPGKSATPEEPAKPGTLGNTPETGLKIAQFTGRDLVLSTVDESTAPITAYPPIEPTLAPGISIDLKDCEDEEVGCVLVAGNNGQEIASLKNVKLASEESGLTLFQITGIPDCRWIGTTNSRYLDIYPKCEGAVSGATPATQYLNITPLLPKEVTDQFPNGLPAMYISPEYRAQSRNGWLFDAFFGVTQDGVVFQDMFELRLSVGELVENGNEYFCPQTPPRGPVAVSKLLEWDIAVTVSEKPIMVVGGLPNTNSDMLTNIGCGSMKLGGSRWSAKPYNLEMNPVAYGPGVNGNPPEDYFADLVVDLFYDLRDTQALACSNAVFGANTATVCGNLTSAWINAKDKLSKCLAASNYEKQSEAVRNCTSFASAMDSYTGVLDAVLQCPVDSAPESCPDRENRRGELKARAATIRYVHTDRLVPSVPAEGFRYPRFDGLDSKGVLIDR